jgi:hypothetical protein
MLAAIKHRPVLQTSFTIGGRFLSVRIRCRQEGTDVGVVEFICVAAVTAT